MTIKEIKLIDPEKTGGMPLMEALAKRKTSRDFSNSKELSPQQLSNLLWAMWGMNRENDRKTAPSAKNWQAIDLYIIKPEAVYKYNSKSHSLEILKEQDCRNIAGLQDFPQEALLNIILISNINLIEKIDNNDIMLTAMADAGFICQNAYLYCASEDLKCVARLRLDRDAVKESLNLTDKQLPLIAMTIGY